MNKAEFLAKLRRGLAGLSRREAEERVGFYREAIEDRMEEGLSEEAAVLAVGSPEEIVAAARCESVAERGEEKPRHTWLTVLLILGSPVWASLVVSFIAVLFSLYVTLWSLVISLWAIAVALAAGAVGGVLSPLLLLLGGSVAPTLALFFLGLVSGGLAIFAFFGCLAATRGAAALTRCLPAVLSKCLRWEIS